MALISSRFTSSGIRAQFSDQGVFVNFVSLIFVLHISGFVFLVTFKVFQPQKKKAYSLIFLLILFYNLNFIFIFFYCTNSISACFVDLIVIRVNCSDYLVLFLKHQVLRVLSGKTQSGETNRGYKPSLSENTSGHIRA